MALKGASDVEVLRCVAIRALLLWCLQLAWFMQNPGGREYATELISESTVKEQIHAKSAGQLRVSIGFAWSQREDTPSKHVGQRHSVLAGNSESVAHHGITP